MEDYLGAYLHHFAVFGVVCFGYRVMMVVKKIIGLALCTVKRSVAVDLTKYGRWAVITGSTDGIGKSYALQMADKDMDIVLISRNPQKLAKVAEEIRQRSKAEVKVIVADFKRSDIDEHIRHIRQELNGLDIGILVNNVGMMWSAGYYCDMENLDQVSADTINVNILSYIMMTNIVLPQMLKRKRGIIINQGSGAGLRPIPFRTMYSATKVFIRFFTEALNMEYSPHGVTFQLVAPSMVDTNMTAGITVSQSYRKYFVISCDEFVKKAIQTIGKEAVTCPHWPHVLEQFLWTMLPDSVLRQIRQGILPKGQKKAEFEKKTKAQ